MYVNFLLDSFSGEKAYKNDFVGVRNSNHLLSSISSLKPEITIKAFSELMKNKEFVKGMLVNVRTGSERGQDLSNTFLRNVVCGAFYREFEYDEVPSEEMIKIREEFLAVLDEVIKEQPLQAIKLIPTLEVYAELDDLKDNNLSEDDFLEATLVYVEEAKCLLGQYLSYKNI